MRLRLFAALALTAVAVFTLSCGSKGSGKEILVGEYGSLTGGIATFGISTKNASEMAFDEINKKGGVLGKQIKLLVEDDQSKPEEAGTAVTKLINQDHVVAMLGHVASSHSLAAAPICQSNKVPMITPSSTNPRVTQVGDYIFRVCFTDTFTGEVVAKFVADTLKAKKVAILVDVRSDYSVGLQTFFGEAFKRRGGEIVANQSYSQGDSDFRAQLTQIKATNPEAIYVPGYYTEVGTIVHQGRELGITVPFVGSDGWDSPKLWEIGGEALNGCYFSNHYSTDDPNPAVQKFVNDYKTRFGQTPDALAALGYDAARILADAMTRAGSTDGDKVR
jgi:branched-chain amino acid transport system substrate-binding protein